MVRIFFNFLFFAFSCYLFYQAFCGIIFGEFMFPSRSGSEFVSFEESPFSFIPKLGFTVLLAFVFLIVVLFDVHARIDKKVKAYGGNYNLNTFKAILKKK
jgi:hypothetical protein